MFSRRSEIRISRRCLIVELNTSISPISAMHAAMGDRPARAGAIAAAKAREKGYEKRESQRSTTCLGFSVNEFAVASVMLIDTEKQTLAVGLTKLVSNPRYADWSAAL